MGRTISVKIRPLNKVCAVSLSINAVIKVVSSNMPHAITIISAAAFLNFFIIILISNGFNNIEMLSYFYYI